MKTGIFKLSAKCLIVSNQLDSSRSSSDLDSSLAFIIVRRMASYAPVRNFGELNTNAAFIRDETIEHL